MANAVAGLQRRIDAGSWPLAVGDLVALAAVFSAGAARHNGAAYLLDNPAYWATTLLPFLLGWVVAAPLLGAYSPGAVESTKSAVPLALRAWVVADVVALALRASPLFHGGVQPVFVLVTLVSGAVGLGLWRWLFFRIRRGR
ncbi:MAG: DUF3054 domain-containing protein [Haloferacaceae archaeon]